MTGPALVLVVLLVTVMVENVVSVRPNNSTEQFLIDCRLMNRTIEECEKALLQFEGNPPIINQLVMEPIWYNPIALGILGGIAAIVGYGVFSIVRYLRKQQK